MSAISLGLAATAILVSMFLVMALVEHLIIPRVSLLRSRDSPPEIRPSSHEKPPSSLAVGIPHARDVFVVMPGEEHPTFLAQLAPLPLPREGMGWPSHCSSVACM